MDDNKFYAVVTVTIAFIMVTLITMFTINNVAVKKEMMRTGYCEVQTIGDRGLLITKCKE